MYSYLVNLQELTKLGLLDFVEKYSNNTSGIQIGPPKLGKRIIIVSDGKQIRQILNSDTNFQLGSIRLYLSKLLFNGSIAFSNNSIAYKSIIHKAMQKGLSMKRANSVKHLFQKITKESIQRLKNLAKLQISVDMEHFLKTFSIQCFCVGMLGYDMTYNEALEARHDLSVMIDTFQNRVFSPFPNYLLSWLDPDNDKFVKCKNRFLSIGDRVLEANMNGRESMVQDLLNYRDSIGNCIPIELIKHQVRSTVFGGHDNVGQALTNIVLLLLKYPDIYTKLRNLCKFGSEDKIYSYILAIIIEGLRILDPVPIKSREPRTKVKVGGETLYPGDIIILNTKKVHLMLGDEFNPERILDKNGLLDRISNNMFYGDTKWFPFSAGAHRCLGPNMAKVVMVTWLREFGSSDLLSFSGPEIGIKQRWTGVVATLEEKLWVKVIENSK